jgi:biotin carboxyl carrier protein
MRYEVEIDGRRMSVDVDERDGRVVMTVGGRSYEAKVTSPERGVYLMLIGDDVYEASVWPDSNSLRIKLRDRIFTASVIDPKHRRQTTDHSEEGQQHVAAPMAGKVVRVLARAGDVVAAGQGVVVVEAMKMQNEIKSPKAGRLIEVRVSEGASVKANQVLAVVE